MRETKSRLPTSGIGLLILVLIGILILGDLNRRMVDARRLERDADILATQVSALETQNAVLVTQMARTTDDSLVIEWAHEEAKMVRDGEVLVIPITPPGGTPLPQATPTQTVAQPSNWEVWWALIFGD
jgi:cell division protein FtsB